MEEKIIAIIKQPVASNIVRGIYYIVFGVVMLVVVSFIGDDFSRMMEDVPLFFIVPICGVIFSILGIGNIVLGIMNSGFKEIPIIKSNGKLILYGHVLATPLFSKNKKIEMDAEKAKAAISKGNVPGAANKWWKIHITDGTKAVKVRVLKFVRGSAESLISAIND